MLSTARLALQCAVHYAQVLSAVEANLGPERRHFAMFQARIGGAPDQVGQLRGCELHLHLRMVLS